MEESGFFVTLPSNSSNDIYPNNKISCYTTKFAKPIELTGDWEVALTEVQYPHTWYSLKDWESLFFIRLKDGTNKEFYTCQMYHGYYGNIEHVVYEMNRVLKSLAIDLKIIYNALTNKIRMQTDKPYTLETTPGNLSRILGMDQNKPLTLDDPEAPYPADIHGGFYTMYVYTDIIHYQRVGDSFVPLLRCVHIRGKNNEIVTITYDKPHYVPVSKSLISDIVVEVKSDQDNHISFLYGKFVAKLHFRPAKHSFRV
nr:TPA_asm: penton [Astyanax tetra cavefish adintovirus]